MSTICLDFDGVLHSYTSGWQGADVIPDPPVPGAVEFVKLLLSNGFSVAVFSARSHQVGGRPAMHLWLEANGFPVDELMLPEFKPPSIMYIDDRGFHFEGTFPTLEYIQNFKPWNKQEM